MIFGATGKDWLLILNHDDGDRQWQEHHWGGTVPGSVKNQIRSCTSKGRIVTEVASRDSWWYVRGAHQDGYFSHAWGSSGMTLKQSGFQRPAFGSDMFGNPTWCVLEGRNGWQTSGGVNEAVKEKLDELNREKKKINFVRLFHFNNYFIHWDNWCQWIVSDSNNSPFDAELHKMNDINDVAQADDNCWLIVGGRGFKGSQGVASELTRKLARFYSDQRDRRSRRQAEITAYHDQQRVDREAAMAASDLAMRELERQRQEDLEKRLAAEAEAAARDAMAYLFEVEKKKRAERDAAEEREISETLRLVVECEARLKHLKRRLASSVEALSPAKRAKFDGPISAEDKPLRTWSHFTACAWFEATFHFSDLYYVAFANSAADGLSLAALDDSTLLSTFGVDVALHRRAILDAIQTKKHDDDTAAAEQRKS